MLGSGTFIIVSTSLQLENRSLILQQMAIGHEMEAWRIDTQEA